MNFKDFQIDDTLVDGLSQMGIETPTPVQEKAIPILLKGRDLIGGSQTGTGKTAAYLVPLMQKLIHAEKKPGISALILAPTRELAQQIDIQVQGLGFFANVSSVSITGGGTPREWDVQAKAIREGCDIVIATPGRLMMYMNLEYTNFSNLHTLILDEADRMLDMGFVDDIMKIISKLPKKRQTILFSATIPHKLSKLTRSIMDNPEEVSVKHSQPAGKIKQIAYPVANDDKTSLIRYLADNEEIESMIVFCGRKKNVNDIVRQLSNKGFTVEGIHSDKEQSEREESLRLFRNQQIQVVVATDVLSRGIDIVGVSHVVNFDVPGDSDDYIHRVGRTARADKSGKAITFVSDKDFGQFKRIQSRIKNKIERIKLPHEVGKQPSLPGFFDEKAGNDKESFTDKPKKKKQFFKKRR